MAGRYKESDRYPVDLTQGEMQTLIRGLETLGVQTDNKLLTENFNYNQEQVGEANSSFRQLRAALVKITKVIRHSKYDREYKEEDDE